MNHSSTTHTLLAFDFGLRRVGVAIGVSLTATASPLKTIHYKNLNVLWDAIDALVDTWKPQLLLVGEPGDETHPLHKEVTKFVAGLKKRYDLPISLVNEEFSSIAATERLIQQRRNGRRQRIRKEEVDQQAAVLIIETWFNAN